MFQKLYKIPSPWLIAEEGYNYSRNPYYTYTLNQTYGKSSCPAEKSKEGNVIYHIKKSEYYFDASESLSTDNKKYAYRYAYRYANGMRNRSIMNSYIKACNFELKIFGSVLNPQIIIGGYEYLINDYLENGEYIIVDSLKRTVTKIMNDGTAVNIFDSREKKRSVFQKIRSGRSLISWSGKFDFMLTLYEERAEPQWH